MQDTDNLYDVVIVGSGPAGLSAAIYMARAKYKVLVLEKEKMGGQITITAEIVNYPGVERTSGKKLTQAMKRQAENFGAEFAMGEVLEMELEEDVKTLHTTCGIKKALGVILAPGANPRKLGFKGEKEFQGRGIAYCATCDGEFFTGMEVFVIGGGFAAVEEGIFLTKYASKVTMIVREEDFTCARTVSDKLKQEDKISVIFHTEIIEASGDSMVTEARFRNNQTGEEWSHKSESGFGIFVFAGYVPNTEWINGSVKRNEQGYLLTDNNQKTNLDGVYAAGDVCVKNLRQVVTAVSDGAVAATSLEKHLSILHDKLKLPEFARNTVPQTAETEAEEKAETEEETGTGFLSGAIKAQLQSVFPKFEHKVQIRALLDESPLSAEVKNFLGELDGMTDRISIAQEQVKVGQDGEPAGAGRLLPSMDLYYEDGTFSGISFHGVPGGHEFNSFIIALYNVAGPGQQIDQDIAARIAAKKEKINLKVLVSLSCTMCPEVVMAAQKAASLSGSITAEMVDLMHYPKLKEQYKVMSVPCMVVNDSKVYFGKKSLAEVADIIEKA